MPARGQEEGWFRSARRTVAVSVALGVGASETSLRGLKSPAETWVVAELTRAMGNPLTPLHMQESLRLERPIPPMPASQAWV